MRFPIAGLLLMLAAILPIATGRAADAPLELKWAQLVPPAAPAETTRPKTFFSGATPQSPGDPNAAPPPPLPEGKFMSMKRRQPGADRPPAVVTALDGKHVKIGGYVVPLDFEATKIKEFLLVPFVGACIHVPPPPANQIIYVRVENGFEVSGSFEPVTVIGQMKTATAYTGLADAGYSIDADSVELLQR